MHLKITKSKIKAERIHLVLLSISTLALALIDCELSVNANPVSSDLKPSPSTSSISSKKLAPSSLTSPSQISQTRTSQTQISQAISIKKIEVVGSTVFDAAKLDPIIKPLEGKQATKEQLTAAANAITQLYISNGYVTSQALFTPNNIVDGVAKIQVLEGKIERIDILGVTSLNPDYVRSRTQLGVALPSMPIT